MAVVFHIPGHVREFRGGVATPLAPDAEISIVPAVSGG